MQSQLLCHYTIPCSVVLDNFNNFTSTCTAGSFVEVLNENEERGFRKEKFKIVLFILSLAASLPG